MSTKGQELNGNNIPDVSLVGEGSTTSANKELQITSVFRVLIKYIAINVGRVRVDI